jgi:hypothetical protein
VTDGAPGTRSNKLGYAKAAYKTRRGLSSMDASFLTDVIEETPSLPCLPGDREDAARWGECFDSEGRLMSVRLMTESAFAFDLAELGAGDGQGHLSASSILFNRFTIEPLDSLCSSPCMMIPRALLELPWLVLGLSASKRSWRSWTWARSAPLDTALTLL